MLIYLIFNVKIVSAANPMLIIQKRIVIFVSCSKSPFPLNFTVQPGSFFSTIAIDVL